MLGEVINIATASVFAAITASKARKAITNEEPSCPDNSYE